ncbi:DUF2512 family protein [Neobacillus mesonae]|uniref:DUF2512 family protein n=1 Tax=Neobacillus mesonae TaxID=1193713 RepID=UPI0037CC8E66
MCVGLGSRASDILAISAVIAIVSYVAGNLFILRVTNNTVAAIVDFVISFAICSKKF